MVSFTRHSFLFTTILLCGICFFSFFQGASSHIQNTPFSEVGEYWLVSSRRSLADGIISDSAPTDIVVDNSSFVLAAERTYRKDPYNGYKHYNGGWNISNKHYWASVAFTAVPLFLIGIIWFLGFGLALLLICCCYCCCPRRNYSYSRKAYAASLILLLLFTCAAIIGCIVLYNGQGKFHGSTSNTLDYVVGQANFTVENLRNFSDNLAAAKKVSVDQIFMPADVQGRIDDIDKKVNASANSLETRTESNSKKIRDVLDSVRLDLIIIAAVMLFLAFLGFLLSILGLRYLVYVLVIIGWILVAGTFILCGVFLLFHNPLGFGCVALQNTLARVTFQPPWIRHLLHQEIISWRSWRRWSDIKGRWRV